MVIFRLLLFTFALLGAGADSLAQTWDGGAGSNAYGTAGNWNPDGVPGVGASIVFNSASANSQCGINLGAVRTVTGIQFIAATGTSPFTFSNNSFTIGSGGITNFDGATQVFNSALTLSA